MLWLMTQIFAFLWLWHSRLFGKGKTKPMSTMMKWRGIDSSVWTSDIHNSSCVYLSHVKPMEYQLWISVRTYISYAYLSNVKSTTWPLIGREKCRYIWIFSLFLVSLCQGWGAARTFFTASSDSPFHPPMYLVFFFFQSFSSPAILTSLLTQSSHLSLGLPRLLLPCSRNYAALFGGLSSAILPRVQPTVICSSPVSLSSSHSRLSP